MYCNSCGQTIPDDAKFCPNCGAENLVEKQKQLAMEDAPQLSTVMVAASDATPKKRCPKCGGVMSFQPVAETKKRSCLGVCGWIFLCILTLGIALLLIPLLRGRGSKVTTWAVCQSCGYKFQVK